MQVVNWLSFETNKKLYLNFIGADGRILQLIFESKVESDCVDWDLQVFSENFDTTNLRLRESFEWGRYGYKLKIQGFLGGAIFEVVFNGITSVKRPNELTQVEKERFESTNYIDVRERLIEDPDLITEFWNNVPDCDLARFYRRKS